MKKQSWKGAPLLAPVPPVLVSCGSMEQPRVLTVAWTGITNSVPPKTYISVRPERYSYEALCRTGEFVINLPTQALLRAVDLCGVKSGRDTDKFALAHLTPAPCAHIAVPQLDESPVTLECKITQQTELGSHTMFMADIVGVNVADDLVDEAGKLHIDRAGLITYAHGEYFAQGKRIGSFGCSVKKKK